EGAGNNNFHNEKLSIIHFVTKEMEKLIDTSKGIEYLISFISSLPRKVIKGSGLVNGFLNNKFMPDIHWPAAMDHDFYYEKHKDTKSRHKADLILENIAKNIYENPDTSLGENTAAFATTNIMKKVKKESRLELKYEQIKQGGFLPILFVGIGAASALAGRISSIVNTIIERKHKIAAEKEQERHNKEMEKIVNNIKTLQVGSGIKKKTKKGNQSIN
ncbi:Hypothetical protein CINCED_3A006700, partial [Cinara cedri]